MDLSKKNRFSIGKAINYIPHTEKKKKVKLRGILDPLGLCSPPFFHIYYRKWT